MSKRKAKICSADQCDSAIVFLTNQATSKTVPVDLVSITPEENVQLINGDQVFYQHHHVSHFKTCRDPNRFSKGKK